MKRQTKCFVLAALAMLVSCGKDEITAIEAGSETDYSEIEFERTISIVYSTNGTATVSGNGDEQAVSISGNGVTIANSGSELVQYSISGSTTNGFLKIYSPTGQSILLNGASITNPNGAAINIQGSESSPSDGAVTYIVLSGNNTMADGSTYSSTPSDEDEKGAIFGEGSITFSGEGSLAVNASGKSGIVSDDNVTINSGTITINTTSSTFVSNGDTTKVAGLKAKDAFVMNDGTLTITCSGTGAKGMSGDGTATFNGGTVDITVTGSNFGSSSGGHGGNPWGGGQSSSNNSVAAKGIKFDGNITINGGVLKVSASNHEGIETKGELTINDGHVYSYSASDDAINSASTMTLNGGYVCGHATSNDAIDANGNMYLKGGVVYAIGASSPEVALDANTEGGYKLYVQGGTLIAIGGLENGSSLTQSCYSTNSWNKNTWYSMTVGSTTYAFKTPSSGGSRLVVSGSSQPTLMSGVSVSGGTEYFNGMLLYEPSTSGGSTVSLSTYSGGNGGGHGPGF